MLNDGNKNGFHIRGAAMTGEKRKRQLRVRVTAAVLILAAAAAVIYAVLPIVRRISLRDYFHLDETGDVGLLIDFEMADHPAKYIEGAIYLDYETARMINPSVWYDEPSSKLIVTTPYEKHVLDLAGGTSTGKEAGFLDGVLYISLEYFLSLSDVKADIREEPKRVHLKTRETYLQAVFTKKTRVRCGPGIRYPAVTVGKEGSTVLYEPSEDGGWILIADGEGISGYVKRGSLGEGKTAASGIHTEEARIYQKHLMDGSVHMVFHQTGSAESNQALAKAIEGVSGINVIAPTWFYLDSTDGDVRNLASAAYVKTAHDAGMQVWAVFNDFDGYVSSPEETAAFLQNYKARGRAVSQVTAALKECGADGLNLDFELARLAGEGPFLEFIRELAVEMRNEGLVFSIDNSVPTYTGWMNRAEQARVADYIVTMCYDEHTASSEEAGSVASQPFVEKGLDDTLKEVPGSQLIAALPLFTRMWTTTDGTLTECSSLGMDAAKKTVEEYGMTVVWDDTAGQNYAEAEEGNVLRQIWLEDARSAALKQNAAKERGCAGFAWWKLGFQSDDIWGILSN